MDASLRINKDYNVFTVLNWIITLSVFISITRIK
nr:MAG TPA: hypothetical protein [Caudoviricetes sp.]